MFEPNFNDLDAVFLQKKYHRRVQQVHIAPEAVLLGVGVEYFGLGDFLRAKKILTRPPSVVSMDQWIYQGARKRENKEAVKSCSELRSDY